MYISRIFCDWLEGMLWVDIEDTKPFRIVDQIHRLDKKRTAMEFPVTHKGS